jgi:hypothetical protein
LPLARLQPSPSTHTEQRSQPWLPATIAQGCGRLPALQEVVSDTHSSLSRAVHLSTKGRMNALDTSTRPDRYLRPSRAHDRRFRGQHIKAIVTRCKGGGGVCSGQREQHTTHALGAVVVRRVSSSSTSCRLSSKLSTYALVGAPTADCVSSSTRVVNIWGYALGKNLQPDARGNVPAPTPPIPTHKTQSTDIPTAPPHHPYLLPNQSKGQTTSPVASSRERYCIPALECLRCPLPPSRAWTHPRRP